MKSISSTIARISESIDLHNKREMLRIRIELSIAEREANLELAKRLARLDTAENDLKSGEVDYLAQARDILNK